MIHPVSCGLINKSKDIPEFTLIQSTLQTKGTTEFYNIRLLLIEFFSRP
jgi:hypothetical protein